MSVCAASRTYKALGFMRRDFKTEVGYRLSFVSQILGIFFSVVMFYFISVLFGEAASPHLSAYGGGYFPFVLIGIAFYRYLSVSLSTFSNTIREGQVTGTLEAMLVTPTRPLALLLYSSFWDYLRATCEVLTYLVLGVAFFGLGIGRADVISVLVVLLLTILSFSSFGIVSAAFVLVYKRGDPVPFVFGTLSALLGGVYCPVTVLPGFMQAGSALVPLTYSLRAMRHALLQGTPVTQLGTDLAVLAFFSLIGIPLGLLLFDWALRRAKKEGTLAQY